jgi:hypothetical protein
MSDNLGLFGSAANKFAGYSSTDNRRTSFRFLQTVLICTVALAHELFRGPLRNRLKRFRFHAITYHRAEATVLIKEAAGCTPASQLSVGPISLRYWSQDNLSVSVPQFQHDGVTDLDRVLLTVDTDDEVNGRGLFRGRLGRRRRNYNLLSSIGSAR